MPRDVVVYIAALTFSFIVVGLSIVFWSDFFGLSEIERVLMAVIMIPLAVVCVYFGVKIKRNPPRV